MSDGCYASDRDVDEPPTPADRIARLERENAALRETARVMASENAELGEDKARLDYLISQIRHGHEFNWIEHGIPRGLSARSTGAAGPKRGKWPRST